MMSLSRKGYQDDCRVGQQGSRPAVGRAGEYLEMLEFDSEKRQCERKSLEVLSQSEDADAEG
jgi:hypothetical protein